MNTTRKFSYLSLYSGCGGFDLGFKKAGFNCLGAIDIDEVALKNFQNNIRAPVFISDLSNGELPQGLNVSPDIVLSGSPCQGFSTVGKRQFDDPRNSLLLTGAKIAIKLDPLVFVAENVPGVISGKHKSYWDNLVELLNKSGYKVSFKKINAYDLGVPQRRSRIFLVATKRDGFNFDLPTIPGGNLREALANLNGLPDHNEDFIDTSSKDYLIANSIGPGQKLSNVRGGPRAVHTWEIPKAFGIVSNIEKQILTELIYLRRRNRIRDYGDADPIDLKVLNEKYNEKLISSLLEKNFLKRVNGIKVDLAVTFNGKFRRLKLDEPSCTVDTRFGSHKHFLHPKLNRGFTVREAARIQSFPDDYLFDGTKQSKFKMIGNAVPPKVSYYLAKKIKKHLQDAK